MNDRLTPDQIVTHLAAKAGPTTTQVRAFLQAQADMAAAHVKGGYPIAGVGVLLLEVTPSRQTITPFGPKKGQLLEIAEKKKVKFTVASAMKDVASGIQQAMPDVLSLNWFWPEDEVAGDSAKPVDFNIDRPAIRTYIDERVAAAVSLAQPISAIEVGFKLSQSGVVVLHFDARAQHSRDGEWMRALNGPVLEMPHWKTAFEASGPFGATFVGLDGKTHVVPPRAGGAVVAGFFGEALRTIVIQAMREGALSRLSLSDECQLDLEEFDGVWAWPGIADMGKSNRIRILLSGPEMK